MLKFKAFLAVILTASCFGASYAQIYEPVKWSFESKNISATESELSFTAKIEEGWHIYAIDLPSDEGPLPTEFNFESSDKFGLIGGIEQGKYITEYDPNFKMDLNYFEKTAVFKQKIKRLSDKNFKAKGELSFMVCNAEMCLPPEYVSFDFKIKGAEEKIKPENGESKVAGQDKKTSNLTSALNPSTSIIEDSEIYEPAAWAFYVEDETDSTAVIVAKASIEESWHLYSMFLTDNTGPDPTTFNFEISENYLLIGDPSEGEAKKSYDPNFGVELEYFEETAHFKQKIRKLSNKLFIIEGYVRFSVCDDSKCLSPENAEFSLDLKAGTSLKSSTDTESIGDKKERRSNWGIFIVAFLSGFAALLTPCVFPMIPMTVSFFTKQSKNRAAGIKNAIVYGLSIIVIYVVLGVGVTAIFGGDILSKMATNPWFNLAFFFLLIIFAISFLGAFEITLPSSWVNKADARADKGGLIGIFFMAFTLALVSFSCTGPIVGTLIVEAATKGGSAPAIGMLGFSLAIALPFALFAAFPGWLNSLPQSGGWLNSVKVVLGFLELALAFKFLSNADMVLDLHLLEREVFIAFWIIIFGLLTLYLIGKLKLPHDSEMKSISVPRVLFAVLTGTFTLYLIPGLWGAPLKLVAAFPPPLQYSESPMGIGFTGGSGGLPTEAHNENMHLGPQNLFVFHDYDKGFAYAKEKNLPVMLDFTGKACVNCRKMEQQVWSDLNIKRKLAEDLVLISLYVDFDIPLPEAEQKTIDLGNGRKRKLRTVGDKWAAFQEMKYKINAQPYYVLLDHNEEMLVEPANYQDYGEVDLFDDWLDRGIEKFQDG